ncbi:hypothetical protein Tdes44962_MAKER09293 [Teratosphaeria destructans]|uniref:Uncharacterized protein n=1 Tax=Teratosphaeria destructans TaxID=418781 RepID=A0A9W7STR5_9PEZI|nr:hypothetical protein Tdes44962_MAKER09293 [Teratosphaeria destructans]
MDLALGIPRLDSGLFLDLVNAGGRLLLLAPSLRTGTLALVSSNILDTGQRRLSDARPRGSTLAPVVHGGILDTGRLLPVATRLRSRAVALVVGSGNLEQLRDTVVGSSVALVVRGALDGSADG